MRNMFENDKKRGVGLAISLALLMAFTVGCSDGSSSTGIVANASASLPNDSGKKDVTGNADSSAKTNVEGTATGAAVPVHFPQEQESAPVQKSQNEGGVLKKAGDLFEKAKSGTGATAQGAKDWVQDKLSGAADASGEAADDTMKWATETFKSLKEKGLTTASSTSEWLSQDWQNMQSWEYKTDTFQEFGEELDKKLNRLGAQGWECYHVEGVKFYFKKPADSFLRHLPFNDFIKLVPLLQQAR